jgi:mono/diheme cytochrome c family protein
MWNHGHAMQEMMSRRGMSWPQFQDSDMADLIACVRSLATNPKGRAQLRQADTDRGRRVFSSKHCDGCHAIRGMGNNRGPDLGARALPRTLGQFAGSMWNHAPAMWDSMSARGLSRPQFSNQEMADLIAYLFTERYFERAGDSARGARLFAEKSCGGCHAPGAGAPSLANWRGSASPIAVAAELWNHGPLMLARMREHHVAWPRFRAGEVADLLEFLNQGRPAHVTRAEARK